MIFFQNMSNKTRFDFNYHRYSKIPNDTPIEDSVVVVDIVGSFVVITVSVFFVPVVVDAAIVEVVALSSVTPSDIKIIEINDNHFRREIIN